MKKFLLPLVFIFLFSFFNSQISAQSITSGPKPVIDKIRPDGINVPLTVTASDPITQEILTYEATIICGQTSVELKAQFNENLGITDSYSVESIPYAPVRFGFEGTLPGANIIMPDDDYFTDVIDMDAGGGTDFKICFFQNTYTQFIINDNGVVTFDLTEATNHVGGDPSRGGWSLRYSAAEAADAVAEGIDIDAVAGSPIRMKTNGNRFLLNNSIYLPGHDLITTGLTLPNEFYYNVYGTAPNRRMVIGLKEIPMYGCFGITQTHQIIIYETTNIIETHIQNIDICAAWNGGLSLIGIQNDARDQSFVAPGRDTGVWDAAFESWRFIPDGATTTPPVFTWYRTYDYLTNTGTPIIITDVDDSAIPFDPHNPNQVFNPLVNTRYFAEVRYIEACSGLPVVSTVNVDIVVDNDLQGEIVEDATLTPIEDVFFCAGSGDTLVVKAETTFDPLVYFVDYQWREVSGPSNVGSMQTYTIDSAAIELAGNTNEIYEVTMSLYLIGQTPGVDTPACSVSDLVNVIVGTPSFDGLLATYCAGDPILNPNPIPENILPTTGVIVFTINNGGVIDANTGEIDLIASGTGADNTGIFEIILTAGTVPFACSTTPFVINISSFSYPSASVCVNDVVNPLPTATTSGGDYTIDNGGSINILTGEIDLTDVIYTTGGTDNTGDFEITYTVGVAPNDCGVTFDLHVTSFDYPSAVFCAADTNPVATNITTSGGVFSINNGGVLADTSTGEIDLADVIFTTGGTDGTGNFRVTYTTGAPTNCTIYFDISVVFISYPSAEICLTDTTPNPTPDSNAFIIAGGVFSIDNGGVINITTGEVDLTAAIFDTGGTDNSGDFEITFTFGTPPDDCGVTFDLHVTSFDYPSAVFCAADTNPVATNITTSGGIFSINNGGVLADTTTGEIDLADVIFTTGGTDGTGNFRVTYTTGAPTNCTIYFDMNVTSFSYPNTSVCEDDTLNPLPDNITTAGGIFTIDNGGVIDAATGEIDLTDVIYTTGGTDNSGEFVISYTVGVVPDDCTVTFDLDISTLPNVTVPNTLSLVSCNNNLPPLIPEADFNIDDFDSDILNVQDPADFTVTYQDQNGDAFVITSGIPFVSEEQTITATVTNNATLCTNTISFNLTIVPGDDTSFYYEDANGDEPIPDSITGIATIHLCKEQSGTVVNPLPHDATTFASGGNFSILPATGAGGASIINPNTGAIDFTVIEVNTYIISYTSVVSVTFPCPTTTNFELIVDPSVDASITISVTEVCEDDTTNPQVTIDNNISINQGGVFSITTTTGNGTAEIDAATGEVNLANSDAGIYDITYTINTVCTDAQTIPLEIIGLPEFTLPDTAYICPDGVDANGDPILNTGAEIIAISNVPGSNYTYEWFDSNNVPVNTVESTIDTNDTLILNDPIADIGLYYVIATSTSTIGVQCISQPQIIQVVLAELPVITNVFVNDFSNDENSITVEVEGGTGDYTYTISYKEDVIGVNDGQLISISQVNDPIFENIFSEEYTIQVVDNLGCTDVTVELGHTIVLLDAQLHMTPNGDGRYDTWNIREARALNPDETTIYVFDKFGKVLAKVDPRPGFGWDGTYNGKQMPASDYWYTAEYIDPNTGQPKKVNGHFSIVRKGQI